ncbi:MAG: hypothetical protein ACM3NQ_05990 [Bacteroidales bacterium]
MLAADPPVVAVPHVRAVDPALLPYIREGCRRSPTFHALVERIEHSDVIVYLESVTFVPPLTRAYLRWVGANTMFRFVRIAVKIPASTDSIIALLGHELHHASEVAAAIDVRDEAAFDALFRRVGEQSPGGWETAAARLAGALVKKELLSQDSAAPATAPTGPIPAAQPALSATPTVRR